MSSVYILQHDKSRQKFKHHVMVIETASERTL